MASLTALAGTLASTLATTLLAAAPAMPPPPPAPEPTRAPGGSPARTTPGLQPRGGATPAWQLEGGELRLNGLPQRARWLWLGSAAAAPAGVGGEQLWLPLEVLQDQLGVSSRTLPDGTLDLEWFGRGLRVPPAGQRPLADEVAVEVAGLLRAVGVAVAVQGDRLELSLPPPRLQQVRSADQPGLRRVVLDLEGPALVRSDAGLLLGLQSDADQRQRLRQLGLPGRQEAAGLRLAGGTVPRRVFTLGSPARVVLELPAAAGTAAAGREEQTPIDPRLLALLGRQLEWRSEVLSVAGERVRLSSVRLDPAGVPLALRPLSRPDGMQGLSGLGGLARQHDALVAINGGYFNRVRRLPLGALRSEGRWLSGPILNRGVVAWEPRSLPRFGRLRLEEWLSDDTGRSWPVGTVNSGYVERGLGRYTADWGRVYTALSGNEQALALRDGLVVARYGQGELAAGVPLRPGEQLVVARAGAALPEPGGGRLRLESRPSSPLGEASFVVGGGPLLLQEGRTVLDGAREGFGPAFMGQGAPRTVIGSDGRRLWLVTLEGIDGQGPTLAETAWLLQGLGLRDALNLDGGSSTGLVLGGRHTVKGRGVAAAVHHGIGLVPAGGGAAAGGTAPGAGTDTGGGS